MKQYMCVQVGTPRCKLCFVSGEEQIQEFEGLFRTQKQHGYSDNSINVV